MTMKQDAIADIVSTAKRHEITLDEIAAAMRGSAEFKAEQSSGILGRLFGYIGGLFVFAGLSIYIGMQWDHLNSAARIILTLGPGFCAFAMALVCCDDARFEKAATPLFLVAAILEPVGILVTLKEFAHGGDPAYGLLFLHFVMALQQGCAFYAKQRTLLALTTIYFTLGFFAIAFDLLNINEHLIGLVIGSSLLCIGWALDQSRHKPLAGLVYFFGSGLFLGTSYDWLNNKAGEFLILPLACGTIFLSTVARSRALLVVGSITLLCYVGDFMYDHFKGNLAGPVGLMLIGFMLIGVGALAVRINNKYIRESR